MKKEKLKKRTTKPAKPTVHKKIVRAKKSRPVKDIIQAGPSTVTAPETCEVPSPPKPSEWQVLLASINEPEAETVVAPYWDESMAEYPAGGPGFLQPAEYLTNWQWSGFAGDAPEWLTQTATNIAQNPALARLAWHCYWRVFRSLDETVTMDNWPACQAVLGDRGGVLYLLVAMAMVPLVRQYHQRLSVPEKVTRDTCRQVQCFCQYYERGHWGHPGINRSQLGWLRLYTRQPYFRLGRFEYQLRQYTLDVPVFRHRTTGEVLALAKAGTKFTHEGQVAADEFSSVWEATLEHNPAGVTGYPLSPLGRALRQKVTLAAASWNPVLAPGDWGLNMHIPAGGQMTPEACRMSLKQAFQFFPRYWPDRAPRAVWCGSWIFSTCLENILPADANIVKFQRELYLCPGRTNPDELWFVFQQSPLDLRTAPRDTSLQRAIAGYLDTGQQWRSSWMFLLAADVDRFGSRTYQRRWPPADFKALLEPAEKQGLRLFEDELKSERGLFD
jgi:hypothetical protein